MTMGRREWIQAVAALTFVVGLLIYGFACYRVVLAGGLSAVSARPTCTAAAVGTAVPGYRATESLHLRRGYLPPSATCEWSSGATAALVPADATSWAGPVLIASAALTGAGVTADGVRRRRAAAARRLAPSSTDRPDRPIGR